MATRLCRSDTDKIIGGVCGGLGAYVGIDPLIVRIAFVVLAMASGVGATVYLILWIVLPVAKAQYATQQEMAQKNVHEIGQRATQFGHEVKDWVDGSQPNLDHRTDRNRAVVVGAVLICIGLLVLLDNLGLLWGFRIAHMWPLLLIALGILVLLNNLKDHR